MTIPNVYFESIILQNKFSPEESHMVSWVCSKDLLSILDLNHTHLEFLLRWKEHCLDYLRNIHPNFNVNKVDLYFHFPIINTNLPLHLHVVYNQVQHPLEQTKMFYLKDVIQHLSENKNLDKIIIGRNIYLERRYSFLSNLEKVKNPFLITK